MRIIAELRRTVQFLGSSCEKSSLNYVVTSSAYSRTKNGTLPGGRVPLSIHFWGMVPQLIAEQS